MYGKLQAFKKASSLLGLGIQAQGICSSYDKKKSKRYLTQNEETILFGKRYSKKENQKSVKNYKTFEIMMGPLRQILNKMVAETLWFLEYLRL